jgi:RimJ/RimL family protein N-acetyltransferase
MSDPEVMRYWSSPPHVDEAETGQWFSAMLEADRAGESDEFVIEHKGVLIGKMGAWRFPEIGFFVRSDRWGQGYATEALSCYIDYVTSRGIEYVTADVDPLNSACLKVLGRAGFYGPSRSSGTYRVGERVCDSLYLRRDLEL